MEITLNGKRYKVQAIDELTLEDCVFGNRYMTDCNGSILDYGSISPDDDYSNLPTRYIAYKVLLYGLLQSVAHKLNGEKTGGHVIFYYNGKLIPQDLTGMIITIDPTFATKELAEEAIRIFQASKFDLKKLFQ